MERLRRRSLTRLAGESDHCPGRASTTSSHRLRRPGVVPATPSWLANIADEVTYPGPDEGPIDNFQRCLPYPPPGDSNSTFSIWGAAVAATALGDTSVWAPAFFRGDARPRARYEYDQQWSFVDELPGGWRPNGFGCRFRRTRRRDVTLVPRRVETGASTASRTGRVRRGPRTVLWTQSTAHHALPHDWLHAGGAACWARPQVQRTVTEVNRPGAADPSVWRGFDPIVEPDDVRATGRREKVTPQRVRAPLRRARARAIQSVGGFLEPCGILDLDRVPESLTYGRRGCRRQWVRRRRLRHQPGQLAQLAGSTSTTTCAWPSPAASRSAVRSVGSSSCPTASSGARRNLGWLAEHCEAARLRDLWPTARGASRAALACTEIGAGELDLLLLGGHLGAWRFGRPDQVVAPWFHIRTDGWTAPHGSSRSTTGAS